MDEINDFFDFSKPFERINAPRGAVAGIVPTFSQVSCESKIVKREETGTEYAQSVIEQEELTMEMEEDDETDPFHQNATLSHMDDLEDLDDNNESNSEDKKGRKAQCDDLYEKYNFESNQNENLPIHDFKNEIVSAIRKNSVTILEGDTGCGKTTQVPQYILNDAYQRREYCNIICTQPRRIAAISIARRVCTERKWEEGTIVGYKVGLHGKFTNDTRLLYCTTGVLLQRLVQEKNLRTFTHIILDEVHERDQDMDFLLIVIRRLLMTNSRHVKIILMSATISTNEFANYFKINKIPAPVIKVDTRRLYNVKEHYLCELNRINSNNVDVDFEDPGISSEMYSLTLKLIFVLENIEQQENLDTEARTQNSILIFLPGINEIDRMDKKIEQFQRSEQSRDPYEVKLMTIRLHSLISPDEQQKVFHRAPPGHRKVILATNIAESSITVPDVKYVIDYCLTKVLITDTNTNFTSLQLVWASKANCKQRAGRAGRVMQGRVYRMVPKHFYENYLDEFSIPEMVRCPLENVVLKAKLLDMGPPPNILGLAMTPPNLSDIHNTILILKEAGALFKTAEGIYSHQDGDLSFIGRVMAALPLDIRLSRLIIFGYLFSAFEEAIIIAAGLSVRSIFKYSDRKKGDKGEFGGYTQKLVWADGSASDLIATYRAYRTWTTLCEQHKLKEENSDWADRFHINLRAIKEMHLLVLELRERLEHLGIKEMTAYQRIHWMDQEKVIILKIIIAGAFYPNYFIRSNQNDVEHERGIYHVLCGHDPCSTVYFNNFNTRHIGQLYTKNIKDIFKDFALPKNIDVRFQPGSEKIFVTFKSDPEDEYRENNRVRLLMPGRVRSEVYKAIKLRYLQQSIIRVMETRSEVRYAEERGLGVMFEGQWQPTKKQVKNPELVVLPSVFTKVIRGYITHIESCEHFFFQPLSEIERLKEISQLLNNPNDDSTGKFINASAISKGMILAAPIENKYHRAKVITVIKASRQHLQFRVFFIDYGNTAIVDFDKLRRLNYQAQTLIEIPPRVFECKLAMVQPSSLKCPSGKWPTEANEFLQKIADNGVAELEIYSVVSGISSVFVKCGNGTVNDMLVDQGLARSSDENYMSKNDHDFRLRKQSIVSRFFEEDHSKQNEEYLRSIQPEVDLEVEPPPARQCVKAIHLRGPFSPLETKVFPAIRIGTWKTVNIERESVNSVLLDTDPQDSHERLIVAAGITESANSHILTARQTTQMPNIHGFAALMTLIFCPTMQIKRDPNKTKYVSILAGLGCNERMEPLFEEHDMVLSLDVELLKDDLETINQIRYAMDTMLQTDPDQKEKLLVLPNMRADLAARIRNLIVKLMNKPRKFIDTYIDCNDNRWEKPDEEDVIETPPLYGARSIFPMHSALRLYDETFDRMYALASHCKELHRLRQFDGTIPPTVCRLCSQTLENITTLRIHLLSKLHRDREHQIRYLTPR